MTMSFEPRTVIFWVNTKGKITNPKNIEGTQFIAESTPFSLRGIYSYINRPRLRDRMAVIRGHYEHN